MQKIKKYYIITIGTKFVAFDIFNNYPYLTDWFELAKKYKNKEEIENDLEEIKNIFKFVFVKPQIQTIEII